MTETVPDVYMKKLLRTGNRGSEEVNKTVRFDKCSSQAMKGIAILMMLMHHMYLSRDRFEGFQVSFAPFAEQTILYLSSTSKICVAIYALISGYGLYLSYKKSHDTSCRWTAKRLIKTMSGFWIIWIIAAIIFQVMFGYVQRVYFTDGNWIKSLAEMGLDFLGLAKLFGTATMNGTWWYMSVAVIFVICVPLIMKNEECMVLILAMLAIIPRMLSLQVMGKTEIYAFLPTFLMGMCVAKYGLYDRWFQIWNHGMKKVVKFLLELVVLYALYKAYGNLPGSIYSEIRWGIFPVIVIAFCSEFITVIPGIRQVFTFIGKHSMNIFLVHTFLRQYFWKEFIYSFGNFAVNVTVLFLISLLISIVLEWLKKITGYNRAVQMVCEKI